MDVKYGVIASVVVLLILQQTPVRAGNFLNFITVYSQWTVHG